MANYPFKIGKATVNSSGGDSGNFWIKVVDYDGTVLLEKTGNAGDTITLPTPPTHDRLTFQEWSCSQEIVDNTVTFVDNNILVGATYITTSGATEFDITLNKATYLTVTLKNLTGMTHINWGDGTTNSTLTHTYASYGTYTISVNGVTSFGEYIFSQSSSSVNYYCTAIRFGSTVTSIGEDSFKYCYSIETATIPNNVTSIIGSFVFCYALINVVLPSSITTIGSNIFQGCSALVNVVIANSVTTIERYAMAYCESLLNVVIPNSVITLGDDVFIRCYSLTNIIIPDSVTSIGSSVFYGCHLLTTVKMSNAISSVSNDMFNDCYSLSSITLHEGITSIGNMAFSRCYSLINIVIPNSVISIGNDAFNACDMLKEITLSNNLVSIGDDSFRNCYAIKNVVVPGGVTSIGSGAFDSCYIVDVYDFTKATVIPTLGNSNVFSNINKLCKIVVPDNLYDDWIVATNWSKYKNYIYKASEI